MSADDYMIARTRALADASADDFSDEDISVAIEAYPLHDTEGRFPEHEGWEPRYCLFNAAADVLEQRAVKAAKHHDVNADGANLSCSQVSRQLLEMSRRYRARGAVRVKRVVAHREWDSAVANLPEEDE